MKRTLYITLLFLLTVFAYSCQKKDDLLSIENALLTKIKQDAPYIANLEAVYGLSFIHSKNNIIKSDDYYIRTDKAKVFYGYDLNNAVIKIIKENEQKILFVKLPQPKQIAIDRGIESRETTHDDYKPVDENKNPINIDKLLTEKLEQAIKKYEEKTINMTKSLSQEYFETLAKRFGLQLKLEFTEQPTK